MRCGGCGEFACGCGLGEDVKEGGVAVAEQVVGLAAMVLLAAYGEQQAVEAELLGPVTHADFDGDGEALANAMGGEGALGGEPLELRDGLLDGRGVDVFLGLEVEVEGAFGDPGGGGDVVDAGVVEALFAEDLDGRSEDLVTAKVGEGFAGWSRGHETRVKQGVGNREYRVRGKQRRWVGGILPINFPTFQLSSFPVSQFPSFPVFQCSRVHVFRCSGVPVCESW